MHKFMVKLEEDITAPGQLPLSRCEGEARLRIYACGHVMFYTFHEFLFLSQWSTMNVNVRHNHIKFKISVIALKK